MDPRQEYTLDCIRHIYCRALFMRTFVHIGNFTVATPPSSILGAGRKWKTEKKPTQTQDEHAKLHKFRLELSLKLCDDITHLELHINYI